MECTLCRLLLEGTVPGKTPRSDSQVCSALLLELFAKETSGPGNVFIKKERK